jgi:hypothetical protein
VNTHQPIATSLRLDRRESTRLLWALALSLVVHLSGWGVYEGGQRLGLWQRMRVPAWLQKLAAVLTPPPVQSVVVTPETEPPLVFIDVRDSQAVTEPPKNAVGYSDKNSVAANPESPRETNLPKLDGSQDKVPHTETIERKPFDRLMPAPPVARDQPPEEARAKPESPPGDLNFSKPESQLRPDAGTADRPKPRTLTEARLRNPASQIPGEKMKQDAGTRRISLDAGFDVKASPFGAYDRAFIAAVSSRWYDLLEARNYAGYQPGKVMVEFRLNYDGRITEMRTVENTVTDTLGYICQKAILDPAPYEKWPREMRLMIGEDSRKITFTFYYN